MNPIGIMIAYLKGMNKFTALKGTIMIIDNPELTSWVYSGWSLIESVSVGQVKIIKE